MGAAAAPVSLAASGLSAFGKISAGDTAADNDMTQAYNAMGQAQNTLDTASTTSAYDKFKAQSLSDSAEYGRVSALETDTTSRMQLSDKLANIAAVRGATGADPSSPTGAAIMNRTETVSDLDREQRVGNIAAQTAQDALASGYYRSAGHAALQIGNTEASQFEANAAQYESNASSAQTNGFLGAAGVGLTALAGLKLG